MCLLLGCSVRSLCRLEAVVVSKSHWGVSLRVRHSPALWRVSGTRVDARGDVGGSLRGDHAGRLSRWVVVAAEGGEDGLTLLDAHGLCVCCLHGGVVRLDVLLLLGSPLARALRHATARRLEPDGWRRLAERSATKGWPGVGRIRSPRALRVALLLLSLLLLLLLLLLLHHVVLHHLLLKLLRRKTSSAARQSGRRFHLRWR